MVAELQECGQGIDGHNQLRQGVLKLEEFWKVKKWSKRMLVSLHSSCLVDAFNVWEYYHPPTEAAQKESDFGSRIIAWTCAMVEELLPKMATQVDRWGNRVEEEGHCELRKNFTKEVSEEGSTSMGRVYREQQRCAMCVKHKRHNKDNRSHKTIWHCESHPDVFLCNNETRPCLAEHKKECEEKL